MKIQNDDKSKSCESVMGCTSSFVLVQYVAYNKTLIIKCNAFSIIWMCVCTCAGAQRVSHTCVIFNVGMSVRTVFVGMN